MTDDKEYDLLRREMIMERLKDMDKEVLRYRANILFASGLFERGECAVYNVLIDMIDKDVTFTTTIREIAKQSKKKPSEIKSLLDGLKRMALIDYKKQLLGNKITITIITTVFQTK